LQQNYSKNLSQPEKQAQFAFTKIDYLKSSVCPFRIFQVICPLFSPKSAATNKNVYSACQSPIYANKKLRIKFEKSLLKGKKQRSVWRWRKRTDRVCD
jgi:hypothetical protein